MYSLKVITREIRFCRSKIGFKNVLSEAPQTSNPYVMCGSIKALYNVINIFLETKFLILYTIPTFLLSILHTLSMCFFHVKFLSIHIPRKDVDSTDSTIVPLTSTWPDTLNVLRLFLNKIYLVLLMLMVSLFELHHETTACRFRLTSVKSILPSLSLKTLILVQQSLA